MRVFHGSTSWKVASLAQCQPGLYVTDTPERAQLYADAQASGVCDTELRYCAGSAVIELEVTDGLQWRRRSTDHGTLDKCESTVDAWRVLSVVVRMTQYSIDHAVDFRGVRTIDKLHAAFGDKLNVVIM